MGGAAELIDVRPIAPGEHALAIERGTTLPEKTHALRAIYCMDAMCPDLEGRLS